MATTTETISALPGTPTTAVALVQTVKEIYEKNFPVIAERTSKLKTACSALKTIQDDKADAWAEAAIVKGRELLVDVDTMRKAITKPIDDFKARVLMPENELKTELERIRTLRNQYANDKAAKKRASDEEIEKQKIYKIHEAEIKTEMKAALEYAIAKKLTVLETFISDMFSKMSLDEESPTFYKKIVKQLDFKPALKPDFISTTIGSVPYKKEIVSEEQFKGLLDRALAYKDWSYQEINAKYLREALGIVEKWRAQLMPKVRELEKIAAGGEAAEAAKKRLTQEEERRQQAKKKEEEETARRIETEKTNAIQDATLGAEFDSQLAKQAVEDTTGGRKKKVYRLDPTTEKDFAKFAGVIGKIALHIFTEVDSAGKRKSVFKLDAQGYPKRDEKGDPIYIDGISFWLNELSSLPYDPKIPGLLVTEEISTIARKK